MQLVAGQATHPFVQGTFRMKPHVSPVVICVLRHLFSSIIVEKFTQDSLWLSIATRHPWDQFTRAQRLTSCMTLLLCNMVTSLMFWRMNGPPAHREEQGLAESCVTLFLCFTLLLSLLLQPPEQPSFLPTAA